jgi:hypothetical protein
MSERAAEWMAFSNALLRRAISLKGHEDLKLKAVHLALIGAATDAGKMAEMVLDGKVASMQDLLYDKVELLKRLES